MKTGRYKIGRRKGRKKKGKRKKEEMEKRKGDKRYKKNGRLKRKEGDTGTKGENKEINRK